MPVFLNHNNTIAPAHLPAYTRAPSSAHLLPLLFLLSLTQDEFHRVVGDSELLFFFGMNLFDLIDTRNYKVLIHGGLSARGGTESDPERIG